MHQFVCITSSDGLVQNVRGSNRCCAPKHDDYARFVELLEVLIVDVIGNNGSVMPRRPTLRFKPRRQLECRHSIVLRIADEDVGHGQLSKQTQSATPARLLPECTPKNHLQKLGCQRSTSACSFGLRTISSSLPTTP